MKTVVLINDDPVQLALFTLRLKEAGYSVVPFHNSEEALLFLKDPKPGPPDLIITDLYMPGIDGWRVCRLLRSPEYKQYNHIPILVMSATFSGKETEEITKELGANSFLASPVPEQLFLSTVSELLEGRSVKQQPVVLIIEDSRTLLPILFKIFADHGCRVVTAVDGRSGEELFTKEQPDVVILDYHLPEKKGDELLVQFKKSQPRTVVIMMSADPDTDLAIEWMKMGASAYIQKPFNPEYLVTLCIQALRERRLLYVEELLEQRTKELMETNRVLEKTVQEKEVLMKEVHHRVKNNLSLVTSLLRLQMDTITDKETINQFRVARARIESMSLVHERLYESDNVAEIDLRMYLRDITDKLIDAYSSPGITITPVFKLTGQCVKPTTAINIGLILNELLTNSLQHGCYGTPAECSGAVEIHLLKNGKMICLTVKDNGKGLGRGFDIEKTNSLGLLLVRQLAEQLGGAFRLYSDNGTVASVTFPSQ